MHKKITIKLCLSLLFLITSGTFGCGSTMIASNAERSYTATMNEKASSVPTARGDVSMRALWTVSQYTIGKNTLWGEKEARSMLFKPLDITETSITFDGKTCRGISFKKEKQKAKEYLETVFHTTPQTLGIAEDEVEVVKTDCNVPGFAEYLRLKDRRLVIYLHGVFFYLEPTVHY
jgi:hypothetical protein